MTRAPTGTLIAAILASCAAPVGVDVGKSSTSGTSGATTTGTGGSTGTGTISGDSGLPCDVSAILSAHCISCHGDPPTGGAVGTMLTYAELIAPSVETPAKTVAEVGLTRMQSAASPMPPAGIPAVSAAEIASWAAWVNGGAMKGSCGDIDAGPPDETFAGASVCASNMYFGNKADDAEAMMYPGRACNACHALGEGPDPFAAAGTVFDTGHVPDNCLPTAMESADLTQAKVVIHGNDGVDHTIAVNANGNFRSGSIAYPYTAKVVYMGKERAMVTPQSDGDCNGCHTDAGKNNAPGRIALPVP